MNKLDELIEWNESPVRGMNVPECSPIKHRDTADALRLLRDVATTASQLVKVHDDIDDIDCDGATCKCGFCDTIRPALTALRAAGLMGGG